MLSKLFNFLEMHYVGILVLFLCMATVVFLIQWLAWIFDWGRFGYKSAHSTGLRYVVADLLVKIIDDFRHLLALIIVVIFAFVLGYGLIRAGNDLESITKVLQVVVATLGGLIGSIIGYYFGESAGRRALNSKIERGPKAEELEQELESEEQAITPAPPPREEPDS